MSVTSWTPNEQQTISTEQLLTLASYVDNDALSCTANSPLIASHAWLMKQNKAFWQPVLKELDQATLEQLIKFFTLIEEQQAHWAGGDKNPVIYVAKYLKKQFQAFPDKEFVQWIKANSQNKFLPYGPLL